MFDIIFSVVSNVNIHRKEKDLVFVSFHSVKEEQKSEIQDAKHVDVVDVRSKTILVEDKIHSLNHNKISITMMTIFKQEMVVVNNV